MRSLEDIEKRIQDKKISLLEQIRVKLTNDEKLEFARYAKYQIPRINSVYPDLRLAIALVIIAKEIYDQGNFWGKLAETFNIEMSRNKRVIIGKIFLATLRKYGLFEIENHKKDNEYVQNILAHCFVPNKYRDSFYEFIFSFYDRNLNRSIPENIDEDVQDLKKYMKRIQNTQDEDLHFEVSKNHAAVSYKLIKSTQTVIAEENFVVNENILAYLDMVDNYFYSNSTEGMPLSLIKWCENKFEKLTNRKLSNYRNIPRFRNSTPFIGYNISNNKVYIVIPERKFSEDTRQAVIEIEKDGVEYCSKELELCQAYGCIKSDDVEFIEIDGDDVFSEFKIFCNKKLIKTIDKNFYRIFQNIKNKSSNVCIDYYEVEEFNEGEICILAQPEKSIELNNAVVLYKDINNHKFSSYIFNMKEDTTVLVDGIPFDSESCENDDETFKLFFNSPNNFKMKTEEGEDIICAYSHPKIYFKNPAELLEKNPFILCSDHKPINLKENAQIKKLSSGIEYAVIDLADYIDNQIGEYIIQLDISGERRTHICQYLIIDDLSFETNKNIYIFENYATITKNTEHYLHALNLEKDKNNPNKYEYKIKDENITKEGCVAKFEVELAENVYIIEIPLNILEYSYDKIKWFCCKKEYIFNHELRNYFYVKIPNVTDAVLYMSNDSYFPFRSKNRGGYLEFDISEITRKVNETDCFKDDLNIEFENYDKKNYKKNICKIINQIYIKSFKLNYDKSNQCVYIDTEFYTGKYKFGAKIKNIETGAILDINLQNGKNYIKELDSQGIYDITQYIAKKNLFGKTSQDRKVIDFIEKQTPTNVLFLPLDCQIIINDLYYENTRYPLNYSYQIAFKGRTCPNYYEGVLYSQRQRVPVIFDFVNDDGNKIYFKSSYQVEFCYDTETKSLLLSDAPFLHKNYSRYLFLDYDNTYFSVTIKENRKDY